MQSRKYKDTYTNANGDGKIHSIVLIEHYLREMFSKEKYPWKRSITLPAESFRLEDTLKELNFAQTFCEINPDIYEKQKPFLKYFPDALHFRQDIFDTVIGNIDSPPYKFAWFDLCGPMREEDWKKLKYCIEHSRFAKNSLIVITLSSRAPKPIKKFYSKLQIEFFGEYMNTVVNFRKVKFPEILRRTFAENDYNTRVFQPFCYTPESGNGSMTLYIIQNS